MKDKVLVAIVASLLSIIGTLALNGMGAMNRADAEALIEKGEAKHEAKMDLVMNKLNTLEVNLARLEEKVDFKNVQDFRSLQNQRNSGR